MKKIMVRADDLGFSKAINYGIYETLKNGVIRNIGFMVNMPDSLHGYELVKDYDICLGQHTNVCVGKPISDPKDIPTLVNADGTFKTSKMYRSTKEDFVDLDEAILEVEAQYNRFKEITGKLDNRNQVKIKKISMIFHGFYYTLKIPEEKALFFRVV